MKGALKLLLAGVLFATACKKPALNDTALIPDDELNQQFTDTLTVTAYTVREDTVDVTSSSIAPLGILHDPHFGKTEASFYIPFTLQASNNNLNLGTSPQLDSIVLYFAYSGTYGDVSVPQTLEVFEMTENISSATTARYYSDATFTIDNNPVGTLSNFVPNTTDSISINGVNYRPGLRMKLNTSFG